MNVYQWVMHLHNLLSTQSCRQRAERSPVRRSTLSEIDIFQLIGMIADGKGGECLEVIHTMTRYLWGDSREAKRHFNT